MPGLGVRLHSLHANARLARSATRVIGAGGAVSVQAHRPCRQLPLAGVWVELSLFACTTGGVTYAAAFADIGQPQLVGQALAELAAAAARNIGAEGPHAVAPLRVEGMTPNPQTGRHAFAGRLSDNRRVEEQVAVFARGTRVFQATMVGAKLDVQTVETFFGALRLPA